MTEDQVFRCFVAFLGVLVVGGSVAEMWYGPRRGMTWGQFFRFAGLAITMGTVLVAQYTNRHVPITGYTVAFGVGALVGSLGVWPQLRTPIIPPRRS